MTAQPADGPPRPISVGDIVASYSEPLREWTAAQITGLGGAFGITRKAAVLELDWAGPEPTSVSDLGELRPLRLSHHAHRDRLSHCNFDWLLPQLQGDWVSAAVTRGDGRWVLVRLAHRGAIGRAAPLGFRSPRARPGRPLASGERTRKVHGSGAPLPDVWRLEVNGISMLDCAALATCFPKVSRLSLAGDLGSLANASALQRLSGLRTLFIQDLFGMLGADAVTIHDVPELEMLGLYSTPADYAAAMRKAWRSEIRSGTMVEIRSPRKPEWVDENRDHPLRDWDGREHISAARYRKAVAHYRATRRAVIAALSTVDKASASASAQLSELGQEFALAFNQLDAGGNPFIETEERDDLFVALDAAVSAAEKRHGRQFAGAREAIASGANAVREW